MTDPIPTDRDDRVRSLLHELDELKARPSQHSAAYVRRVATEAREMVYDLVTDLRGWEARDAANGAS